MPESRTRLYEFTGAMIDTTNTPAGTGAPPGGRKGGDPVDLATGIFVLEKTDLYLPDVIPLALQRTYRPDDLVTRSFGKGATQAYDLRLWSAHNYTEADLILPDSGRVHYVRTSSGTGFVDAVFEHTATPTRYFKSTIAWNGNGWNLTLKDGTVYVFGDVAPLQAIRDRFGNTVTVTHGARSSRSPRARRASSSDTPARRLSVCCYRRGGAQWSRLIECQRARPHKNREYSPTLVRSVAPVVFVLSAK